MTTTKAFPTIAMPDHNFNTVRSLFSETELSESDFRNFTKNVRLSATEHLDVSGFVSVEEQDPAAFQHFLDQVKKRDPTIAKRYPYLWPVLAYLKLYLDGRRRSHFYRHPYETEGQPTQPKALRRVPIWIRFARSEKTGQSLQEIPEVQSVRLPRVSRSIPGRTNRQRPMAKRSYKREPTVMEVDENITQPVDSSPTGPSNRFTAPVSYFLRSFGSSIEGICAHIVGR